MTPLSFIVYIPRLCIKIYDQASFNIATKVDTHTSNLFSYKTKGRSMTSGTASGVNGHREMARKKGRRVQGAGPSEGRGEKYTMKGNGT